MDKIIRAVGGGGFVKMSVITAKDAVQYANLVHDCSPTACAALGRTLCAASMLGDMLKEDEASVTIRINGGGPIGGIVAVSDSAGNVRGYVSDPHVELPLKSDGKLDVGGAVGRDGMFTVSRDLGMREPYVGSTELVSGEIAEDLTQYLLESEQVPSACGLGVLVDTGGNVKAAGGFIAQLMPGAPEELIATLEDNVFYMDQLTTILDEDGADAVFAQVLKGLDYHTVGEREIAYKCYCSRERVAAAIKSVGPDEILSMIKEGRDVAVSCQFCDTTYEFTADDLRAMLDNKNSQEK
jgi:molecular chaperone Hsp33